MMPTIDDYTVSEKLLIELSRFKTYEQRLERMARALYAEREKGRYLALTGKLDSSPQKT
jgi:hypothetical protein